MNNYNDNGVDIPDFIEDNNKDTDSVDMSIFKMSEEELYDDVVTKDKKPYKKKKSSTVALCLIVIGILLVTSVVAIVYGGQQHNAYVKANDELSQVNSKIADYEAKISAKDSEIATLTAKVEELESSETKVDTDNKYPAGTKLYITEDGGGQGIRQKADVDSAIVTKNGSDYVLYWGDSITLSEAATIDAKGNYWGKTESGYIRIEYDGEIWATTEQQ